jgi:hypothetical protein
MFLSFSFSLFKWSEDEKLCARCVTNEAHFYEEGNFGIINCTFVRFNACETRLQYTRMCIKPVAGSQFLGGHCRKNVTEGLG